MNKKKNNGLSRHDFVKIAAGVSGVAAAGLALPGLRRSADAAKPKYDTPTISCGDATQASINIEVCAGASGAPAGFSIQWETKADFDLYAWPVDSSCPPDINGNPSCGDSFCKASFSGSANLSRYNLGANECVTVNVGEFLFDNGASTDCPDALVCGTQYVFRAFAHANSNRNRSNFTANLVCSTLDCEHLGNCTFTQGYWKTHGPEGCVTGNNTNVWPVTNLTLGNVNYTDLQLCSILNAAAGGNGLIALAHQLIAAKLNIANGADGTAVAQAIADADALIGSLVVPPVGSGFLAPSSTSTLTTALNNYNEGATGPGHCP